MCLLDSTVWDLTLRLCFVVIITGWLLGLFCLCCLFIYCCIWVVSYLFILCCFVGIDLFGCVFADGVGLVWVGCELLLVFVDLI